MLRPSRLVKSNFSYVVRSLFTILRIFIVYKPLRFFIWLGSLPFGLGIITLMRWLLFFLEGYDKPRIPTLILGTILILVGFQLWIFGLVADLLSVNRKVMEEIQFRLRRQDSNFK